jgi:transposase-like protein
LVFGIRLVLATGREVMPKRRRRIAYWRRLVAQQAASSLSASAFCREEHINLNQFYRWRRRFRGERSEANLGAGFLELVPYSSRGDNSGIRIRLGAEVSIEVEPGFDAATLRAVVETLGQGRPESCSV